MSGMLKDDRNGAIFDDDREYRYLLWRVWNADLPMVTFIMLNPSTADETEDDATIRRCIGYAKRWGYGRLNVVNLFGLCATDPNELRDHPDPVGPENDEHLRMAVGGHVLPVAAWGTNGSLHNRDRKVTRMLDVDLFALGTTKDGHPWHPLRKPADADPTPFRLDAERCSRGDR